MGRQIHFYMLPEDQIAFLRHIQERDPIVIAPRDSDSAAIIPVAEFKIDPNKILCLWNRSLLSDVEREWVPKPGYYTLDTLHNPIVEFTPSFTATWERKPALGQGRLYSIFDGKPPEFEKWYESVARWIRTNYQKNPTSMGGYVGPAAYEFYQSGGYLLPNFLPPRTKVWLDEIGKPQTRSRPTPRIPKRAKVRP